MFKTIGALTVGAVTAALMASATLAQDYTEPPSFGRVSLSSGFTPDPYVRNLTAGGSIRAQDRFSDCRGYIANAPDFSVNYTAGSLPLIFTGLRLSLGVGWMVLIAAEMLAQNPGLGKFVWDEFQNGSSQSLAKIMVAVLTIGIIGFMLDRLMFALQRAFTFSANR